MCHVTYVTSQVRRPTDYVAPVNHSTEGLQESHPALYAAVTGMAKIKSVVSTNVPDGPNKIYLGNIPNHLRPEQVRRDLTRLDDT